MWRRATWRLTLPVLLLLAGCSDVRSPVQGRTSPAGAARTPARPTVAHPDHVRYVCDDGFDFSADVAVSQTIVHLPGGRSETLRPTRSADGARYAAGSLVYWSRGRNAILEWTHGTRHRCHEVLRPASSAVPKSR